MKRVPVSIEDYAGHIMKCLPQGGCLLSTSYNDVLDTMTIGWGTIGVDWSMPILNVYVRESRFTKTLLDKNPQFTINVPLPGADVRKILGYCGTKSGREVNKFKDLDLHAIKGEKVDAPAILELPLTIECEVIYKQDQDPKCMSEEIKQRFYSMGDYHTVYTGKIINAYILEEDE